MLHHLDLSKVEWELFVLSGPRDTFPPQKNKEQQM